jgi:6-phosphofructokinase
MLLLVTPIGTMSCETTTRVQIPAIEGMNVGYIRKLMNVMRKQHNENGSCPSNFELTTDYTAGQFAIEYILGNYERRSRRQQKKRNIVEFETDAEIQTENNIKSRSKKRKTNVKEESEDFTPLTFLVTPKS